MSARREPGGARDAEITQLRATIASLQAKVSSLEAGMELLRHSASWRFSAPVRVAGRLMRGFRVAGSRLPGAIRRAPSYPTEPVPPPALPTLTTPHDPGDPNAHVIFRPSPLAGQFPVEAAGIVTLDALYHLSRSL